MERSIQIIFILFFYLTLLYPLDKWRVSADVMESSKIADKKVQLLHENVRFIKKDKILLTDNAVQYVQDEIIHLKGNTMMINNLDTLSCDSMIYWSDIDSIYAIGIASVEEINKINILNASLLSMQRALNKLTPKPAVAYIDGMFAPNKVSIKC